MGTLGGPHGRWPWRVWVEQDCTGRLLSRRGSEALSPGFLNWFFPLIHLVLLSGVGWDHPPPAFGLCQHKGWHESRVLNMQPLQRTGLSPSQVVASFLTC